MLQVPRRHGFELHSLTSSWHREAVQPSAHVHKKLPRVSVHVPPFLQGFVSHSGTSCSHVSPWNPGEYGPYRQSERKPMYMDYAKKLVDEGNAYYAFDTSEEFLNLG